jgi:hypothetical protein
MPLLVATIATLSLLVTAELVALNDPELAPAGIVMLAGTDTGLPLAAPALRVTVSPPLWAGPDSATVQAIWFPAITVAGEQVTLEIVAGAPPAPPPLPPPVPPPPPPPPPVLPPVPVMTPPVAAMEIWPPEESEPTGDTLTFAPAPLAMVKAIDATEPLLIGVEFMAVAMHLSAPAVWLQESALPAALVAGPAVAVTEMTLALG